MELFESSLDRLLLNVANGSDRLPEAKVTAFVPIEGRKFDGELMIIGRAVNGWSTGFLPKDVQNPQIRADVLRVARLSSVTSKACPMSWVTRDWGPKRGYVCDCGRRFLGAVPKCSCGSTSIHRCYNTARSAFWRVTKRLVQAFDIADTATDSWPSHLIWSDLYKVSPEVGGNPSSSLCKLQEPLCFDLLQEEIEHWQPRRIVFLTGKSWADPFLNCSGAEISTHDDGFIDRAGRMGLSRTRFVVVPHPQGKPEVELVSQAAAAFKKL